MEHLLNKLVNDIHVYNESNPTQKINWELRRDKLREIIKNEFGIPNKFKKKGRHQSNKYLSRDDLKHLDEILNDLAGYAEIQNIVVPRSRSRTISRSRSGSGSGSNQNRTRTRTGTRS